MKDLAVAIIHGIGSQRAGYSQGLQKRLRKQLPAGRSERVAMEEIFWADILAPRQDAYLRRIKRKTRYDDLRGFVVKNFSDGVAYAKTVDDSDATYERVHDRVRAAVARLRSQVRPGAPLVFIAHSLGGHITSNYVYDTQRHEPHGTPFDNLRTMAGLVTFGCNIPLFVFSYAENDVHPIEFPGVDLPESQQLDPWWVNFYDKDDVLGFPLADIGPHYLALRESGELRDKAINAGSLLSSWNPLAHNGYWKDSDLIKPTAAFLKRYL